MSTHPSPDFVLTVNGQDITARINPRLISLTVTEGREGQADTLEIRLADHDGRMRIPSVDAIVALRLGWHGQPLVDKGTYNVDEVEHSGTPDELSIKCSSANLKREMRQRTDRSWHDTTLGEVVQQMAASNGLKPRIDPALAGRKIQHLDQTNESDVHLLTRLAEQHDAVATVKNGSLLFLPINNTRNSSGQRLGSIHIVRALGDRHRWHTAERGAYSGVRAQWYDKQTAEKRTAVSGGTDDAKTLKETYATEVDALQAAESELQRIDRGKATFSLQLARGRAELMPQTPVTVQGFKHEIDGTGWLVKTVTHTLDGNGGFTTKADMERGADPAEG